MPLPLCLSNKIGDYLSEILKAGVQQCNSLVANVGETLKFCEARTCLRPGLRVLLKRRFIFFQFLIGEEHDIAHYKTQSHIGLKSRDNWLAYVVVIEAV